MLSWCKEQVNWVVYLILCFYEYGIISQCFAICTVVFFFHVSELLSTSVVYFIVPIGLLFGLLRNLFFSSVWMLTMFILHFCHYIAEFTEFQHYYTIDLSYLNHSSSQIRNEFFCVMMRHVSLWVDRILFNDIFNYITSEGC